MTTLGQILKNPDAKIDVFDDTNRKRNLRCRRYDLVAYRFDSSHRINKAKKPEIISNVPAAKVKEMRAALRKDGCYRVDMIEVTTKFRDSENKLRTLTFDGTHDVPEKVIPIPAPEAIDNGGQVAFPWDVVSNTTPAYLPEHSNKVTDIRKEHDKANRIRRNMAEVTSTEPEVRIYEKVGNKLVFSGNQGLAAFFILNNPVDFDKYVYYINNEAFLGE